jgi:thymidylate synthase (FAD)
MNVLMPKVEFLTEINRDEVLAQIERIGRTCYQSQDKITPTSAAKFAEMLIKRGHEAVIEHFNVTIRFTVNRGVSHEMVRHRIASFAQESTRYCNYNKGEKAGLNVIDIASGFKYDITDAKDIQKYLIWKTAMENSERSYNEMIAAGAPPEEARLVLPLSLKTEINMTANLREWRHFIKLRASRYAHPDIRKVAIIVYEYFMSIIPEFFKDLEEFIYRD